MTGAARAGHHNIKAHKWQEPCRMSPLQETRHTFSCRVGWGLILCQSPPANPKPLIPHLTLASCSRLHGNWAAASCLLCMLPYCPVLLPAAGQSETCPWSSKSALPVLFAGCVDGGNAAIYQYCLPVPSRHRTAWGSDRACLKSNSNSQWSATQQCLLTSKHPVALAFFLLQSTQFTLSLLFSFDD